MESLTVNRVGWPRKCFLKPAPLLPACTQKGKNKITLLKEHNPVSLRSLLDLPGYIFDEEAALSPSYHG